MGSKRKTIDDPSSSEESDADETEGLERANKPVSRLDKLTKTQKNAKLLKRMRKQEQEKEREVKLWNKSFNKLPAIVKEYEQKAKVIEEGIQERTKREVEER